MIVRPSAVAGERLSNKTAGIVCARKPASVHCPQVVDELAHAYAMTIHRSQRSGYPAVVIAINTSARMLQRNLLYTAITMAKKLVVLGGSLRALAAVIRTVGTSRRHTARTHRLTA